MSEQSLDLSLTTPVKRTLPRVRGVWILLGLITGGLFQYLRLPTTFMVLAMISLVVLMIIIFGQRT